MSDILGWLIAFGIVQLITWLLSKDKVKDVVETVKNVQDIVVKETEQLSKFNEMSSQEKKAYQMNRAKQILKKLGKENVISDEMLSSQIEQAVLMLNLFPLRKKIEIPVEVIKPIYRQIRSQNGMNVLSLLKEYLDKLGLHTVLVNNTLIFWTQDTVPVPQNEWLDNWMSEYYYPQIDEDKLKLEVQKQWETGSSIKLSDLLK